MPRSKSPLLLVLLFSSFALFSVLAKTSDDCDALGRRKCRRTDGCSWIARQCIETPAPPPLSCSSARRRKCKHRDPYSSMCTWNKETKACDDKPLCQSWQNVTSEGSNGQNRWATMIATISACVPDCIDNPLNQYLPRSVDAGFDLDDAWTGWGLELEEVYDRDRWCPLVYGDELAGKPAVGAWTTDLVGVARDCDDHHSGANAFFTNWVWSFNPGLAEYFTGNRWCCETCGTCQTEKFRCAAPDIEKGAYPCGSDAWGHVSNGNCYAA